MSKRQSESVQGLRVIDHPALPGSRNMAIDQALLESTNRSQVPVLRFYRWRPATLSLGYFQSHTEREQHVASQGCDWVRRASGGGAIMHDRELTYSLCIAKPRNRISRFHLDMVQRVHAVVIRLLLEKNASAHFHGKADPAATPSPFLCFQRRTEWDIELGQEKVCGSAQRSLPAALLQHGSLILERSPFAPELPGINDLIDEPLSELDLLNRLTLGIAKELEMRVEPGQLSSEEESRAIDIEKSRFASSTWNCKR